MNELIKIAKALSDRNRVRILKMLENKPMCVCEITSVLEIANSTVSSHLSLLRDAGLIADRKDGKWVEYRLKDKNSSAVAEKFIALISTMLNDDEIIRKDILSALDADRELISLASILPK